MRNTKYFDLNIFDEEIDLSMRPFPELDPFLYRTLTRDQKIVHESTFLRGLGLASEKWKQVCAENNDSLNDMFNQLVGREFNRDKVHFEFQPFKSGKFWQMMDYLDGNFILRDKNPEESRESYQNHLIMEGFLGGSRNGELFQTGWDLAINSALLSDVMPEKRDTGSIYLFEHIIEDPNSLFYPSVTNDFQKRIVNEAFWRSHKRSKLKVLEKTLTTYFKELDPTLTQDNILRWFKPASSFELVIGDAGTESFHGLSRRAVENYGSFLHQASTYDRNQENLIPLINAYIDAVNCVDEDGIEYFKPEERERLLDLGCVRKLAKDD